jgi:hypothetical protein
MGTGTVIVGVAKQASLGTAIANAGFAHGLISGGLTIEPTQEADPLTSASLSPTSVFRSRIETSASYKTRTFYKSLGLYLYGILGAIATTGAQAPYQHVLTEGATTPYLTWFEKSLDGTLLQSRDGKVTETEIAWEENSPLDLSISGIGGVFAVLASMTPTVDESGSANYFTPVGGTFKYDVDGSTLAAASILGGSIAVKRGSEQKFFSGVLEAGDHHDGKLDCSVSFKIAPEDIDIWQTLLTGTAAGTAIATTPVYGSFEVIFTDGTNILKVEASKVAFSCSKPEADPDNGMPDVDLSGICLSPGGVTPSPIKCTLTNAQATY